MNINHIEKYNLIRGELLEANRDILSLFSKTKSIEGTSDQILKNQEKSCRTLQKKMIEAIFRLYGDKENRFIDSVPLKFHVFDGKKVSLTLPSENTNGIVELVIKNKNMAEAMRMLFYSMWQSGIRAEEKKDEIENAILEVKK